MPDGVHITGLSGHQITGPVLIIKGEILLQELAVYGVTHTVKHTLGTDLKHDLRSITQDSLKCHNPKQTADQNRKKLIISSRNDIIYDPA